jgi:hypothetical protein
MSYINYSKGNVIEVSPAFENKKEVREMRKLLFLFCMLFILTIMPLHTSAEPINESKYGYTIALNGIVYGFTNEEVPIETILIKIGEGVRVISPKVEKDGDIGCHGRSECRSPIGRVFYSLRGISPNEAIAVKTNRATFLKCIKIGEL